MHREEGKVCVLGASMYMPSCVRAGWLWWWCHMPDEGLYFNLESTLET